MTEVLIVDDDFDIRRILGSLLNRRGYQVTLAKSYGWGMLLGKSKLPDVIVADVNLGSVFDGVQMSQQLLRQNPHSRCIIISGDASDELRQRIAESGFRFMPKPIRPNQILELVTECERELGLAEKQPEVVSDGPSED